jgi:hypothetical protein
MMTDPASTIRREVNQLVELQIQTFRQESSLTSSELLDYGMRAEKIRILYQGTGPDWKKVLRTAVE